MKYLLLLVLISCATKYETFNVIDKRNFELGKNNEAMAPRAVRGKKETKSFCAGQFLFFQNAKNITDKSVPALMSRTCPEKVFLMDGKITETWWTTIIYSRSCIKVEAYCPRTY